MSPVTSRVEQSSIGSGAELVAEVFRLCSIVRQHAPEAAVVQTARNGARSSSKVRRVDIVNVGIGHLEKEGTGQRHPSKNLREGDDIRSHRP
jgi:hypothetical protein